MSLPTNAKERKNVPIATGVLDYFPDALAAVAECSKKGNDQHNPGQPLHWAKDKSTDHADCLIRHFLERGTIDTDDIGHSVKVAWRALALLQTEIENMKKGKLAETRGVPIFDGQKAIACEHCKHLFAVNKDVITAQCPDCKQWSNPHE